MVTYCHPSHRSSATPGDCAGPRTLVHGPHDALAVLALAASPGTEETLVLVLDHRHRGSVCLVVQGPLSPAALISFLLALTVADRAVGALVVATGGQSSPSPSAEQELAWFDAREQLDEIGVDLLDWFLLSPGQACSLAELTDSRWRWRSTPGR